MILITNMTDSQNGSVKMTGLISSVIDTPGEWLEGEARKLLDQFGLHDWSFVITNHKRFVGYCWQKPKTIGVSRYYLNSPREQLLDTVLHEIAHALAGCENGHNDTWKRTAARIGAEPRSCAAMGTVVNSAKPNYVIRCLECGWEVERFRMRKRNFGSLCPECGTVVKIYEYRKRG